MQDEGGNGVEGTVRKEKKSERGKRWWENIKLLALLGFCAQIATT
jgi:hypothetical protein